MGRVDGKVALISGGARGKGAADAGVLVGEGAKVIIGDILDEEGKALADGLGEAARDTRLDVTQPDDWKAAVDTALNDFGTLNVLVNSDGIVALGQLGKSGHPGRRRSRPRSSSSKWLHSTWVMPRNRATGWVWMVNADELSTTVCRRS
jgi:NAD(P)-dependent dehydrogenase (short-subunit alcohol dehydrogenase family)